MTQQRRFDGGTPFGEWLRQRPEIDSQRAGLSIQDIDYIVHGFPFPTCHAVMLIEEKRWQGKSNFAQRDTRHVLNEALKLSHKQKITNLRGQTKYFYYYGYHMVTLENTTPEDGKLWFDDTPIDYITLLHLLRFELNPYTLKPYEQSGQSQGKTMTPVLDFRGKS